VQTLYKIICTNIVHDSLCKHCTRQSVRTLYEIICTNIVRTRQSVQTLTQDNLYKHCTYKTICTHIVRDNLYKHCTRESVQISYYQFAQQCIHVNLHKQSINQSYSLTSVSPCLHGLDGLTYNNPSTHRPQPAACDAQRTSPTTIHALSNDRQKHGTHRVKPTDRERGGSAAGHIL